MIYLFDIHSPTLRLVSSHKTLNATVVNGFKPLVLRQGLSLDTNVPLGSSEFTHADALDQIGNRLLTFNSSFGAFISGDMTTSSVWDLAQSKNYRVGAKPIHSVVARTALEDAALVSNPLTLGSVTNELLLDWSVYGLQTEVSLEGLISKKLVVLPPETLDVSVSLDSGATFQAMSYSSVETFAVSGSEAIVKFELQAGSSIQEVFLGHWTLVY
jgi:hypothetical protein